MVFWKRGDLVRNKVIAIVIIVITICIVATVLVLSPGAKILNPGILGQQGGITDVTPRNILDRVSFEDAYRALDNHYNDNGSNFSLYQIEGDSITSDSFAKNWLFLVNEYQNHEVMYIYDRSGLTGIPQITNQTFSPIILGNIIDPQSFLNDHKQFIEDLSTSQNNSKVELLLNNNVYTISQLSNGSIHDYLFDAKTGNQINNP
jgi:hypothetical protein